ncbi:DUF4625 domain-containing protein [Hyphobacterium sp. CCMP332]|nr:DUF4625 domain-containing protein [Hyphobacterium sp. CCMP332]
MKHLIKSILIAVMTVFLITACGDDDSEPQDTSKPIISDVHVENHDPGGKIGSGDDEKVMAGEEGEVHFQLMDNRELGSWKIDIHDAFDGHGHGKVFANYSIILSGNTGGTMQEIEVDLGEIPSEATAGEYHCIINATDAAGNSADFAEVIFILSNGTEPQLELISPDLANTEHMDKGMTFTMEGTLTDDTGIKSFEIYMEEEGHDDHDHGKTGEEAILLFDKDDFGDNVLSFDLAEAGQLTIPADMEDGNYYIKFVSGDSDGNTMIEKFEIHIE